MQMRSVARQPAVLGALTGGGSPRTTNLFMRLVKEAG